MTEKMKKSNDEWRSILSGEEYYVTRLKGTERAFTGKYHDCKEEGIYKCVCCGTELFSSETKYDSGSGWPSFYAPAKEINIQSEIDNTNNMIRTEVKCSNCEAHLGHVFTDGPKPTGLRYCINSASLNLEINS